MGMECNRPENSHLCDSFSSGYDCVVLLDEILCLPSGVTYLMISAGPHSSLKCPSLAVIAVP